MSKLVGVEALIKDIGKIESATSLKIMKQAASASVNPVVRKMKAAAPIGKREHRTYKGRLVAPGFLSRNISKSTRAKGGRVTVSIGVKKEAFYGVQFLDEGNYTVTKRKGKGGKKPIKPYRISGKNWFNKVFERSESQIVDNYARELRKRIDKI